MRKAVPLSLRIEMVLTSVPRSGKKISPSRLLSRCLSSSVSFPVRWNVILSHRWFSKTYGGQLVRGSVSTGCRGDYGGTCILSKLR